MALTPEQQAYCKRIAAAMPPPTPELAARLAALLWPPTPISSPAPKEQTPRTPPRAPGANAPTSTYLTDDQVAERLHLDRKQVQALARRGDIKGFKVGQKWRFTEAAFLAFTGESASAPPVVDLPGLHPKTARRMRNTSVIVRRYAE